MSIDLSIFTIVSTLKTFLLISRKTLAIVSIIEQCKAIEKDDCWQTKV